MLHDEAVNLPGSTQRCHWITRCWFASKWD